ncbi:LacI family DNA-binding transcriptional regulator [Luteipulveratus sp. YIM 133132]|uniref:LacI family DNA-binding transcriptional regulator n=1 Tax=Luteipulveratus flavus TaxID=3031728 RepID=UPI0023B022B6|nr:LacI family DNA-binding transcriptional regulator [Luteipulveratus sp. YIM 133132]MDE9365402.1 LacI family DNA-binding transcriptional regulator [Luteipulveratus sp. YIM 133132]
MTATLKDVAELAGVSVKTVSNVVNGYAFVRAENRLKVEAALAQTGYRPNIGARNLRRGRTGFLALVVPDLGIPYFGELAGLVITAAQSSGWNVLIEQTQGERDRELESLGSLGPHFVDGAIVSPEALVAEDVGQVPAGFPVVLLGEQTAGFDLDRVGIDNVAAARAATQHLIDLGRTRIAMIGDNPRRATAQLRLQGYRQALTEAGLPVLDDLVAPADSFHRRDGVLAMRGLLDRLDGGRPDAVFCCNDLLAVGALHEAVVSGLRVPEDIAVVGFDGSDEARYSLPPLSTVAPDKGAIATSAVRLISERVSRRDGAGYEDVQAPFVLETRQSTTGITER